MDAQQQQQHQQQLCSAYEAATTIKQTAYTKWQAVKTQLATEVQINKTLEAEKHALEAKHKYNVELAKIYEKKCIAEIMQHIDDCEICITPSNPLCNSSGFSFWAISHMIGFADHETSANSGPYYHYCIWLQPNIQRMIMHYKSLYIYDEPLCNTYPLCGISKKTLEALRTAVPVAKAEYIAALQRYKCAQYAYYQYYIRDVKRDYQALHATDSSKTVRATVHMTSLSVTQSASCGQPQHKPIGAIELPFTKGDTASLCRKATHICVFSIFKDEYDTHNIMQTSMFHIYVMRLKQSYDNYDPPPPIK